MRGGCGSLRSPRPGRAWAGLGSLLLLLLVVATGVAVAAAADGCDLGGEQPQQQHGACYGPGLGPGPSPLQHSLEYAEVQHPNGTTTIEGAKALASKFGFRVVCYSSQCVRDDEERDIKRMPIADSFNLGGDAQADGAPQSLVNFLALETATGADVYTNPQPEGWDKGNDQPTAVFEVGRYRLPKSGGATEVQAIVLFQNQEFDPRMAPVVVASVRTTAKAPAQAIHATLVAVSHDGFIVTVGSPFHVRNWDKEESYDLFWFAYGFTVLHEPEKGIKTLHPDADYWK